MAISVSIVIPAYNEERRLETTLMAVTSYLYEQPWDWEVRVVDDGSADATVAIATRHAESEPRVVVQSEPHRGKGGAVRAGLTAARGEFRFICDADLSMPIGELSRFLPPVAPAFDVAIGSREGRLARRVGEPAYRHLMGRLFNRGVQLLVLPGIDQAHPNAVGKEVAKLLPNSEKLEPWKEPAELIPPTIQRIRKFLQTHTPS